MAGTLVAPVEDGKIVETSSQTSLAKTKDKNSDYSKDTFLKLLVAEVQNQDPLEPTSNTEWISQYATFSELEAMQNMSASFDLSRASTLVGKTVVLQTTSESGKVTTIQGKVDYVTYEGGQAYLSINGSTYSMDDLHDIVDTDYMSAFDKVYEWSVKLNKLPAYENLTYNDREDVESVYNEYDKMSDYEKTFVASENEEKIKKLHERMQELIKIHEGTSEDKTENNDEAEEPDKTE
ncbi:MAG: flagellar hook capping protein [Lachnospiraceae bacterium]|nr:flagellar hook capping protein [Lachnospiraceae bacterium]